MSERTGGAADSARRASAAGGGHGARPERTVLGVERLLAAGPGDRRRVGLLSNQSAIVPDGRSVHRALVEAGFPLVRIFGPEHGFRAEAQDTASVADGLLDGVEVVSLYGPRTRPEPRHVDDLDAVIIDIQDVGCRYYTYLYTAAEVMDACARAGTEAVVCDRPNPAGARWVEGGAIAPDAESEVGQYGLAQRHGMTVAEFARYVYLWYLSGPEPTLFTMEHYARDYSWRETGLPWKQPSPNFPHPETALIYPGTCLFEGTNISEGRGTTRPFETIGAPWIDPEALRDDLSARDLGGVIFSVSDFTPAFSAFAGEACRGVQLHLTDPGRFRPLYVAVHVLDAVRRHSAERFAWRPLWQDASRSFMDWLAGGPELRKLLDAGGSPEDAYALLSRDGERFREAREAALLYSTAGPGAERPTARET
jgi:uncharacterized protein YbbC (DUF1343 family)